MILPDQSRSECCAGILRIKNHKSRSTIVTSAHHTWRKSDQQEYPHVSLAETHKNIDLIGATNSAELLEKLDARLDKAKHVTCKSNLCLEFLITADYYAFAENGGPLRTEKLVEDARTLIIDIFGAENIIGFNVQLDELTPHIVIYVVPIIERPETTICKTTKEGFYADGSERYVEKFIKREAFTSLSSTHFYKKFGGKSGMQTLFSEFLFEPNGLRRGLLFSRMKHINARDHKVALHTEYSYARANIELKPDQLNSLGSLLLKSKNKILSEINDIITNNAKPIIAKASEYESEKNKNASLNKTLRITQKKLIDLEKENNNLNHDMRLFNELDESHKKEILSYIKRAKLAKEELQKAAVEHKEKQRNALIEELSGITINSFISLENGLREKLWWFMRRNEELLEKFMELANTGFFNAEDGSLSENGISHKHSLSLGEQQKNYDESTPRTLSEEIEQTEDDFTK